MDWFPEFVLKYLTFTGKCFRHCDKPTSMRVVSQNSTSVVGAYVCPDGFVSQVVYFSLKPDMQWFERMLSDQVGMENFSPRDIRIASRHGWELGGTAREIVEANLGQGASIREAYWTRYAKTEEQKQLAVSLCQGDGSKAGCMKLFMHDRGSVERLCPACKAKLSH
jgi:hypothetical protein